jgi:hypothetical protein
MKYRVPLIEEEFKQKLIKQRIELIEIKTDCINN